MKSKSDLPRRLIVNADDFGLSRGVNQGIAEAFDHGILTSATLLANAPEFDEAVRLSNQRSGLGVGVHLNLVRGRPLSPIDEIPMLAGADGRLRRFRLGRLTRQFLTQAEKEYRRQIEKVLGAGIRPTHVDFEKHHAWQGPLYLLACKLAGEYGIGAARTLREPVAWSGRKMGWPGAARMMQAAFLRTGFDLGGGGKKGGVTRPDRLLGQCHIGAMDERVWLALLESLPAGVSEVMTHPGKACGEPDGEMGGSWLEDARQLELSALLSGRVRDALDAGGIELVHFGALGQDLVSA